MEQSRIILGQIPPILADLVRQLLNERTEVWILPSSESAELMDAATRVDAHVVVVSNDNYRSDEARRELSRKLRGRALAALDARGRSGMRYLNGRLDADVGDLSPATLRELLRPP
jgi:hypothetical protein